MMYVRLEIGIRCYHCHMGAWGGCGQEPLQGLLKYTDTVGKQVAVADLTTCLCISRFACMAYVDVAMSLSYPFEHVICAAVLPGSGGALVRSHKCENLHITIAQGA